MKNKAQKTLNGIMIIIVLIIVVSYVVLNLGGLKDNTVTGMVVEDEEGNTVPPPEGQLPTTSTNQPPTNNPTTPPSSNPPLIEITLKDNNKAYTDSKGNYFKDAQGTQKLEITTASGYDWFFYTENGKKIYYDYQVSSSSGSSAAGTPVLTTTTSTTIKIIDNKLYSISYGDVKEYTNIPNTPYYYSGSTVVDAAGKTITTISIVKNFDNKNFIIKEGDNYYYTNENVGKQQIKEGTITDTTIDGKKVKITLEKGQLTTYTSIDEKNTLYADDKGFVYSFDGNQKTLKGYNYQQVSTKSGDKISWYTDLDKKNKLYYSEDNGVTYNSYEYTQDYLGNLYLKDANGNYYIVEKTGITSDKKPIYNKLSTEDSEKNKIDSLDYIFTSWGTTIDRWVYYTSGFSGFSFFYGDTGWIYSSLDETMQNILGGIDGWSSIPCQGEVSSTDGNVAGAYSSNPGGGYAYIKGERITYTNYTESGTGYYYVYKVSGYVDPESCDMKVKFIRKCDDGTHSLFVDSNTNMDYVFSLDEGDDPIAYSGNNMIVAQSSHLCSDVCIQFKQISTGCLIGVSEGDEVCSTIIESRQQRYDLGCNDFYCGLFGVLSGASTGKSGYI